MQFDSQTTQYISTNFVEEKSTDEEGYKSIVRIFDTIIIFPFATFLVVSYIAFTYSNRIVSYATEYILREMIVTMMNLQRIQIQPHC